MKVYHGGTDPDAKKSAWYTTDKNHAASFGRVKAFHLDDTSSSVLKIDIEDPASILSAISDLDKHAIMETAGIEGKSPDQAIVDALQTGGWGADDALWGILEHAPVDAIAVQNWEGTGTVYLVKNLDIVTQ